MAGAHESTGFYGGFPQVSEFRLLKQKQRDRYKRKRRSGRLARQVSAMVAAILLWRSCSRALLLRPSTCRQGR